VFLRSSIGTSITAFCMLPVLKYHTKHFLADMILMSG
jgi:hypothetical protein